MKKVLVDQRWAGESGIGRVLKEIMLRAPSEISLQSVKKIWGLGHPLSPLYLTQEINKTDADIFYSPSFMPPLFSKKPFVITIHDLNHLYFYSTFHKVYLKHVIGVLAKQSTSIITVSQFTKNELVSKLNINNKKIKVVYNGVDQAFINNQDIFICDRPYFLYVGNRRSYKNIKRMLQAFALADISIDYIMIFSGNISTDLNDEITKLGIKDRVRFLGNIPENDLPKIYKGAFALIFVSLMEGFGLPIIEAMASGIPVITSNVTSLPEVAGGAALLVNPYNVLEIAQGIKKLVISKALRDDLVGLGEKRCMLFNWNNTAKETWDIVLK